MHQMDVSFRIVAIAGALLFCGLFAALMIDVSLLIGAWDVAATAEAGFLGRRLGAAFLGMGVLCFLARNLSAGEARRIISISIATALITVATIGCIELTRGFAGPGIILAILVELIFAGGFILTGRRKN